MRKRHVNSLKSDYWMIVDCFAGGGGASTGIEMAVGRSPDVAVNHNSEALAMHEANHPWTRHYKTDVREIDPLVVTRNKPVGLAWFSPDCTFFSKSRGGKPIRVAGKKVRGLAWVVVNWARKARPRVIILENVEEFQDWCPVIKKLNDAGQPVLDSEGKPLFVPCPKRKGQTFRKWVKRLQAFGGRVEWKELRACDYGSPTIRKRLFVIIRFDNEPIVWPEPTHGKPDSAEVLAGTRKPWRTAAEIIDWSLPCPSIFLTKEEGRAAGVNRPLKENTLKRIAKGLERYVLKCKKPFIVTCNHGGDWFRGQSVDYPAYTVTCSRDAVGLLNPFLASPAHSTTTGRGPNVWDANEPMRTQTTTNDKCVVAPVVTFAQHGGANRSPESPLHTVTASEKDQNAVIVPILDSQFGNSAGVPVDGPVPTVMGTGGGKQAVVAPILDAYHGPKGDTPGRSAELNEPLRTQDTSNRHALVEAFLAQHNMGVVGHPPTVPLSTVTTMGTQQNVVAASFVAQHNTGSIGREVAEPLSTIVHRGTQQQVTAAYLSHQYGSNAESGNGGDPQEPAKTVTAGGQHHAAVKAFLMKYYSEGGQWSDCREPAHTVPTKERMGLVTINEVEYMIVDIGMRMLTARELFRAQGFPDDYQIEVWCDDRRNDKGQLMKPGKLTKGAQVRCAGNSVCPDLAAALVRANCAWLKTEQATVKKHRQLELAGI